MISIVVVVSVLLGSDLLLPPEGYVYTGAKYENMAACEDARANDKVYLDAVKDLQAWYERNYPAATIEIKSECQVRN